VRSSQRRILWHEHVDLNDNPITRVVAFDRFESCHQRRKSIRHEHHFPVNAIAGCLARKSRDVLETGTSPIIDDEQGEDRRADRVKPPNVHLVSYQREEKRQCVKVYVRLAVLGQSLDLGCFHPGTARPNDSFDHDGRNHGKYGSWWQLSDFVFTTREKLLD